MTNRVYISGLPVYEAYCHGLSPTFARWCPLTIPDIHSLQKVSGFEGQDIYFHLNHPIRWVRLTGVVVAIEEFYGNLVLSLDDSSGVNIEASCVAPPPPPDTVEKDAKAGDISDTTTEVKAILAVPDTPHKLISPDGPDLTGIDVGAVVKMKGSICVYRGQRRLSLKRLQVLGDTNAEVRCWKEMVDFRKDVLSKPWVVTEEEERNCREAMDNEARWKKEQEENMKRKEMRRQLKQKKRELEDAHGQELGWQPSRTEHKSKKGRTKPAKEKQKDEPFRPSMAVRMRAAGKYDALGF